jgi:hypothetical protein
LPRAKQDNLGWLVGRWRCITRQYFTKQDHVLSTDAEDSLDYFNVYFPFADDHLKLDLTDNPEDRPIAAEFLVRHVSDFEPFEEKLSPMLEWGPVRIGRERIRYGHPPFDDYEFQYLVERRGAWLWLTLESKFMHLEFYKLATKVGGIKNSFVMAPIKGYTAEHIAELSHQYELLEKSLPTSSEKTALPR